MRLTSSVIIILFINFNSFKYLFVHTFLCSCITFLCSFERNNTYDLEGILERTKTNSIQTYRWIIIRPYALHFHNVYKVGHMYDSIADLFKL